MNETVRRPANVHTPPPNEIKTPAGDSGRTSQTTSLSDIMSSANDCGDSVVSEITLDAAFDGKAKKTSDPSFHRNLVVATKPKGRTTSNTRRRGSLLPQETVSKLDGNDFLEGKFNSAFQKEMGKGMVQQQSDETQEEGISKKQELMQKRLATEYANRKRELSNAKLDDLKENSLMDLFTSMNLAVDVPGSSDDVDKKKPSGHRRRRSEEEQEKQDRRHSREITFDPNLTAHIDDGSPPVPDSVQREKRRQERRRSAEIGKRRQAKPVDGRDIQFDPKQGADARRGLQGKSPCGGRDRKARNESQDIVFNPNEETHHDEKVSGFVPPPQISEFQEQEDHPEASMVNLNASGLTSHTRRHSKGARRHSTTSKSKPSTMAKRQPPKDIPESITFLDEDSVNGLSLIGIEAEIRGDTKNDQRARRYSTSPPRRSHHRSEDESETPRRRRHSSAHKSPKKKTNKEDKGSPRRRHSDKEDKERSRRSRSKRRSSQYRHDGTHHKKTLQHADDRSDRKDNVKESKTSEHDKSKSVQVSGITLDLEKEKEKKAEAPSDEHVEVLRKPVNFRRTFSTPAVASPKKEAEPQDDDEDDDEEASSPVPENVVGLSPSTSTTASTSTATPKRGLWKRISKRTSIARPIASLGNERVAGGSYQQRSSWNQSLSSPSRRPSSSDGSRGGSSKRSMSSSSSSDFSLRSSRGSASDRSLTTSPVPTQQQSQTIVPKTTKNYTPTVVQDSKQTLSYSERVMQGKIGISILKPTPEGRTVEEFE